MSEWAEVQLKDIALKITKGTTPTSLGFDFTEEGINFIKAESVTRNGSIVESTFAKISEKTHDALKRSQIIEHDILVSIAGAYLGKIGLVRKDHVPANTNQAVAIVRLDRSKACPAFVKNFLLSPSTTTYLNMLCPQSAQPNLNLTQLGKVKFRLPRLSLQKKIAAILTAYDDLIEVNKRRIALLEKMAEELYREWFVRLRFPGYQNTRFVKGVPEGWDKKKFGEFCVLKRGYDLPDASVVDGPYPVVASTSIKTYHNDFKVKPPVITTGRSGSLGEVLITFSKAWPLNTSLYVREFLGNSPFYIFYTLRNIGLDKFNSGAGVPTLNRNHLNGLPMVVPSKELQQRFDETLKPIFEQAETHRMSNETLTKTRDLLLPRLISGKLSVEDLDIQLPPSMQEATAEQESLPEARHA